MNRRHTTSGPGNPLLRFQLQKPPNLLFETQAETCSLWSDEMPGTNGRFKFEQERGQRCEGTRSDKGKAANAFNSGDYAPRSCGR